MNKKDMRDLLYEGFAAVLSETDFRLKRNEEGFGRRIPDGRQLLAVSLIDYSPDFIFSLTACIRLEAVEELFHLFSGTAPNYQSMSYTTITQLEYFTGRVPSEYNVRTREDVSAAVKELSSVVHAKIVPTLNECMDAKTLDRMVNTTQEQSAVRFDSSQEPWRAMSAITIGHLARNADFNGLVSRYRRELQLAPELDHPLNRLVAYLESHDAL